MGGQRHASAALLPGKTRYPLYRRLGRPQGRSGRVRKIPPTQGFDPRTVKPVANLYTDWAIPAHSVRLYRVSQEECARFRESVPYVKVYRYNPKHLRPKLNGYGDNGQRKVWSSGGSTHCTCQLTSLIDVYPWVWCPITESQLTLAVQLCSRLIPECAVNHVTSVLAIHVSCIVLGTLRTTMICVRVFL